MKMKLKSIVVLMFTVMAICTFGCKKNKKKPKTPVPKPMIYLYPDQTTQVSVKFSDLETLELIHTYPEYEDNGWDVLAHPDGTLEDLSSGMEYYALFWEGVAGDFGVRETGFVVPGEDTAEFLEDALERLGLSRREANEFIVYWLPLLEDNDFNFIHFATDQWEEFVPLDVSPEPDTSIRVMMLFTPIDEAFDIEPQILGESPVRSGFTLVEWGGRLVEEYSGVKDSSQLN
ncbi:MAG: hypothetical protein GY847_32030 [Proteobacteria bacterium]|nr:hypothetical protein [Pseudomonadota bacterium]